MDFNDEFEFKPLSQGLGFHNRSERAEADRRQDADDFQASTEPTNLAFLEPKTPEPTKKTSTKDQVFTIDETVTLDQIPMFERPLQEASTTKELTFLEERRKLQQQPQQQPTAISEVSRKLKGFQNETATPSSQSTKQAVDDILKTLKDKNKGLETKMTPGHQLLKDGAKGSRKQSPALQTPQTGVDAVLMKGYKPSEMSWGAAFLDSLLIFAASLLCMIILLTVTRADLLKSLSSTSDREIYLALFGVFALVTFLYMTVHRVFLGQTPGEWAFDQRLGTVQEQMQLGYIFKAALRSLLTIFTGFILVPIFSFAMRRDVLADVCGLQLYQKSPYKAS